MARELFTRVETPFACISIRRVDFKYEVSQLGSTLIKKLIFTDRTSAYREFKRLVHIYTKRSYTTNRK